MYEAAMTWTRISRFLSWSVYAEKKFTNKSRMKRESTIYSKVSNYEVTLSTKAVLKGTNVAVYRSSKIIIAFQQILNVELGIIIQKAGWISCWISKSNLIEVPKRLILFSKSPNLIKTRTAPLILAMALVQRYLTLFFLSSVSRPSIGSLSSSDSCTSEAFESPEENVMSWMLPSSSSIFLIKHGQK